MTEDFRTLEQRIEDVAKLRYTSAGGQLRIREILEAAGLPDLLAERDAALERAETAEARMERVREGGWTEDSRTLEQRIEAAGALISEWAVDPGRGGPREMLAAALVAAGLPDLLAERDVLLERVADMVPATFDGLMQILDTWYPADVFVGEAADADPGVRIVALTRRLAEVRAERDAHTDKALIAERDAAQAAAKKAALDVDELMRRVIKADADLAVAQAAAREWEERWKAADGELERRDLEGA